MTFNFTKKNVGELSEFQYFKTPKTALNLIDFSDILNEYEAKNVLEPCAGDGAICNYLKGDVKKIYYYEIYEPFHSGLNQKGYQKVGSNFLNDDNFAFDATIMNPPFAGKSWVPFVKRAVAVTKGPVIVLLGCNKAEEVKKASGFDAYMVSDHKRHVFSDGLKNHSIGCAWFCLDGQAKDRDDGIPTVPLPLPPVIQTFPPLCTEVKSFTENKVKNPETNRMIQVDGRVYKSLIKSGYCHINGQLVKI